MNRTAKLWLIAAAVLVLAGGLLFSGVMARQHWDLSALGARDRETVTLEIREDFQSISILADTEDIAFVPSEDGTCRLTFYRPKTMEHTASVQNGTLVIETIDNSRWYDHISLFSVSAPQTTVYLPERTYASLSVEGSTGDITIPGDFSFTGVDISVSTGDVTCSASCSGRLSIETGTGDILVQYLSAGELLLSASTGRIEVRSVACAGKLEAAVSTGKAVMTDVSCGSIVSRGSTGDLTMEDVIAAETIDVERSTGDVRLDRCDAASLQIRTDTGDVTGSLLSGKAFSAQSDTGRVKVPESAPGGTCTITTDTGDITFTAG